MTAAVERNWAGNVTFGAAQRVAPATVEELQDLVAAGARTAEPLRAVGARHSFTPLADTQGTAVHLHRLARRFELDPAAATVTIDASWRYDELGPALHAAGYGLANLASLPHLSVAGACATPTHGSGDGNRVLAAAVRAVELVTADGALRHVARDGDDAFPAVAMGLGQLGVVVALTLDLEPAWDAVQTVHEGVPIGVAVERFDELFSAGHSVSLFTRWRGARLDQLWTKVRADAHGCPPELLAPRFGARPADGQRHPVRGADASACTEQRGAVGPWHERLPHFRAGAVPSVGAELQSELFVARADGRAALVALGRVAPLIAPALHVSEIRTVAADELWLSPAFERDVVAFHFTWHADLAVVGPAMAVVESALEPFAPVPHWAKLSGLEAAVLRPRLPGLERFRAVRRALDPDGRLLSPHLAALLA